jgi:hypothetical protein
MAEKRPKSLLSGLKNMLHRDTAKPAAPPPKGKKPKAVEERAAEKPKEPRPAAPSAEAPADAAAEPKAETKSPKNQPWYRHRQRW